MNRNEIIEVIKEYVRDEKAVYAVLINGGRGTGKTYLYKHCLAQTIEKNKNGKKTNIYVSLYGVSSIEALSRQLITACILSSKPDSKKAKKTVDGLSGIIGIASKAISLSFGPLSIDLDKIREGIENKISFKNMVVCLDDLERCTIPMNDIFGFINNLVEHCNCKVIVLADETNMGKVFANTNPEKKYLSVLSGRKVIEERSKDNSGAEKDESVITISELKKLNELIFSENYIYRDIKEKVIGKTLFYYPKLSEIINELITEMYKDETHRFRCFVELKVGRIASCFESANNRNIRVIEAWIPLYEKIYNSVEKLFRTSKYKDDILDAFLEYSIWILCAERNNRKMLSCGYSDLDYVYFEGNEYIQIIRYAFIDDWVIKHVWADEKLVKSGRLIERKCEEKRLLDPDSKNSTGRTLRELYDWRFLSDSAVHNKVDVLIGELSDGEYEYRDFANIISLLLILEDRGLCKAEIIKVVQKKMLSLIDNFSENKQEDDIPKSFDTGKMVKRYKEVYTPIRNKMAIRNKYITQKDAEDKNIYSSGEAFKNYCSMREEFFVNNKSFFDCINLDLLYELIDKSDLKGLYDINAGLKKVYYMGNVRDFYMADIDRLISLKEWLLKRLKTPGKDITWKIAIENINTFVISILRRLDVYDEIET